MFLRLVALAMIGSAANAAFVEEFNRSYEYIVAGAGAAGLIVAERLAETGKSVLLLERGDVSYYATGNRETVTWNDTVTEYDVPALSYLLRDTTLPVYCKDIPSLAACILGGDTMINGLAWVRPQAVDFDDLFPLGWKWKDIAPAADRFNRNNPGTTRPSENGINYDNTPYEVISGFLAQNGFRYADVLSEPDSKNKTFSKPAWDVQNGLRGGPLRTYFPVAQTLPNFHVAVKRKVLRAVRTGPVVTGVEIEIEDVHHTRNRIRQIVNLTTPGRLILTAGAMATPRILYNSGIGAPAQIEVVQNGTTNITLPPRMDWIDLPVGAAMLDHPIIEMTFRSVNRSIPNRFQYNYSNPTAEQTQLFAHGAGILTQSYQNLNFWVPVECSDGLIRYVQGSCNNPTDDVISIRLLLVHGQTSKGRLGMAANGSTVFLETPWLRDAGDKEAMETVFDMILGYSRKPESPLFFVNNASSTQANTTAKGADYLSQYRSGAHWVGGATMGLVTDTDLKVYGTENLFVADASFHPDLPSGNTQATVMIAAERAVERILALDGVEVVDLMK